MQVLGLPKLTFVTVNLRKGVDFFHAEESLGGLSDGTLKVELLATIFWHLALNDEPPTFITGRPGGLYQRRGNADMAGRQTKYGGTHSRRHGVDWFPLAVWSTCPL